MATNPLPILLGVGALLLLKKKRADEPKEDPKTTPEDDKKANGDDEQGKQDEQDVPKTLDDVEKGSTSSILPPGGPGDHGHPVVNTGGASGYSSVTIGEMMVIQSQLEKLGHEVGKINGKWTVGGPIYTAVEAFQYDYDLEVDGKPGPITRGVLTSVIEGTFVEPPITPTDYSVPSGYSGVNMGEMIDIQKQLNELGHNPGIIDGLWVYGGTTYEAVREFQTVYGLEVDGKPGPLTQALLIDALNAEDLPDEQPAPDEEPAPVPEPVPADDPTLFVIDTKLTGITTHPDFEKPMLLVEQERSSGINRPQGFAYGYDIYQDQRTLGGDGRFIGVVMAKTDNMESSIWFYRSDPSSVTPSIDDRIKGLADRLKGVVAVLGTEMS